MPWDFTIQCYHLIQSRRRDVVVIDKAKKECKIIDMAVPNGVSIERVRSRNGSKMPNLREEIAAL